MISEYLKEKGYSSEVIFSEFIFKIPNYIKRYQDWKTIIKENPYVVLIHRTSNLIDYHLMKTAKNQSKVIYDLDDAVFHTRIPARFLNYSHIEKIIRSADAVTTGSHYLLEYAKNFNSNVFLLPTAVNTQLFKPSMKKDYLGNPVVIGWLGHGSYQLPFLKILKEPLKNLAREYNLKFRIVSALSPQVIKEFENENYEVDFGLDHWVSIEKIPEIIADFDIGVMPLTDEPFSRGKCAMKALEYMSMGIPVVASPVGENNYVIKPGYNGFLASSSEEWVKYIEKIINDSDLRKNMVINGMKTVENQYSLKVISDQLIDIIEGL
jgi:glycosyltransferase involved in cell wall biosynthesis